MTGSEPIGISVAAVLLGSAVSDDILRRRREEFAERYGTVDRLGEHVDLDALRRVRDTDGELKALRDLRRQVPSLSLRDAVQLVKRI